MKVSQFFAETIESTATDITTPDDGALIQYNSTTERWTDQIDISNLGTVTLNGGNF